MKWVETLQRGYDYFNDIYYPCSKIDYICNQIMGIITYDCEQSEIIATKSLEVAEAITRKETYEYIKNPDNYTWYLMVCNLPFFAKRIEWGTSIRGAWWKNDWRDTKKIHLNTCGLFMADGEQETDWYFTEDEWSEFILACVEFVK
jgi:hypothetical protein